MNLPQRATRVRAPLVDDRYGNKRRDWSAAVSTPGIKCRLYRPSSSEVLVSEDRVTTTTRAMFPAGTDLVATDRVVVDGVTYSINGAPALVRGRARVHHIECDLLAVSQEV